jgi:hypothetical protein
MYHRIYIMYPCVLSVAQNLYQVAQCGKLGCQAGQMPMGGSSDGVYKNLAGEN